MCELEEVLHFTDLVHECCCAFASWSLCSAPSQIYVTLADGYSPATTDEVLLVRYASIAYAPDISTIEMTTVCAAWNGEGAGRMARRRGRAHVGCVVGGRGGGRAGGRSRLVTSVWRVRRNQKEPGPTESDTGQSWFLLTFRCPKGGS